MFQKTAVDAAIASGDIKQIADLAIEINRE